MRKFFAFLLRRKPKQGPLPEDAARILAALESLKATKQPRARIPANDP